MRKKRLKWLIAPAVLILLAALLWGMNAFTGNKEEITSRSQLNSPDVTIAVGTGTAAMLYVENELPEAKLVYMEINEGCEATAQGKIDAYIFDRTQLELAIKSGRDGVRLLDENLEETSKIAVGLSPKSKIPDLESKINAFIDSAKTDGTLDDMLRRWVVENNEEMPQIEKPVSPSLHLVVGTTGIVPPYSYYKGTELTGYDIELAYRFAEYIGADVEFKVYDYSSIINAAATGEIECIMANLNVTEERAQAITFSHTLYEAAQGILVRDTGKEGPEFKTFAELSGKKVSFLTGAPFEELVSSFVPDVKEFSYYNNMPDLLIALKGGKTDAILQNNAIAALAVSRDPGLALFPQPLRESAFGFAFQKGSTERDKWQKAYDSISQSTLDSLWEKWTGADDSIKTIPAQDWPGKNGTVTAAVCDSLEPMSYLGENGSIGFDVEVILLMAKELDVHVDFVPMEFAAILPYVESGKADIGMGSIIVTDERREAVDFIEYYPASFVLVVRNITSQGNISSLWDDICSSFEKTFIRENRWQLFVKGMLTTLLITALSILFGILLGFSVFMLCRSGGRVTNKVTDICLWFVGGSPTVVLLMILYYIIFGKVAISGVVVSVIGFTLIFASSVFGLLKIGTGAVDKGQYEAACALGYSDTKTFFKIILPQALPHVTDAFRGEITGLIKATSIVGYIAVQDLTKIGDIVRNRTYDAFFPLIAIAVLYFLMEGLLILAVDRIGRRIDPRKKDHRKIIKGVKTDDKT